MPSYLLDGDLEVLDEHGRGNGEFAEQSSCEPHADRDWRQVIADGATKQRSPVVFDFDNTAPLCTRVCAAAQHLEQIALKHSRLQGFGCAHLTGTRVSVHSCRRAAGLDWENESRRIGWWQ